MAGGFLNRIVRIRYCRGRISSSYEHIYGLMMAPVSNLGDNCSLEQYRPIIFFSGSAWDYMAGFLTLSNLLLLSCRPQTSVALCHQSSSILLPRLFPHLIPFEPLGLSSSDPHFALDTENCFADYSHSSHPSLQP